LLRQGFDLARLLACVLSVPVRSDGLLECSRLPFKLIHIQPPLLNNIPPVFQAGGLQKMILIIDKFVNFNDIDIMYD